MIDSRRIYGLSRECFVRIGRCAKFDSRGTGTDGTEPSVVRERRDRAGAANTPQVPSKGMTSLRFS